MDFSEFWIQNSGKKEQLNNLKHGIRKEQLDKKFHSLYNYYDANNNGTLENKELQELFGHLRDLSGDKVLDNNENKYATSIFSEQAGIQDTDFQGFVKSLSDAVDDIISTEETETDDGGKEIKTEYKDGTTETIAYYSNGDVKWKKVEKLTPHTSYLMEINGEVKELTEEEYQQALQKLEEMEDAEQTPQENRRPQFGIENEVYNVNINPLQYNNNINIKSRTTLTRDEQQTYSSRFVAEALGVDITTEDGKKIMERLSYLPQNALEQLINSREELQEIISFNELPGNFENISNVLEIMYGITLRTEDELKAAEPQREQLITQIKAAEFMQDFYLTVAGWNDTFTDNLGLFGLGNEGFTWLLNTLFNAGENHYQWADTCREYAERTANLKVLNPEKFKEEFKQIYGKDADRWGIDFNEQSFKDLFEIIESGRVYNENNEFSDEYKAAIVKAINFSTYNPNNDTFNNIVSAFGEAFVMLATLGLGAELKGSQLVASAGMQTFSKAGLSIASKQVNSKLLQGALRFSGNTVKLMGPAINEGTKMYAYTALSGTASNITNRAVKFDSEENSFQRFLQTELQVLDNAEGSFAFGAFAGIYGSTVTQKVTQLASRVSSKVSKAMAEDFSKGAVDANKVFSTALEKSIPAKFTEKAIVEASTFASDIFGFTGFETAVALVKNMDGFPDDVTFDDVTNLLWEEFKGQGVGLGQIKGISYLIMWMSGSKNARMQASRFLAENPRLKGATVEQFGERYKINLPDGRRVECKNTNEMISSLYLMARGETAFGKNFNIKPQQHIEPLTNESRVTVENLEKALGLDENFDKDVESGNVFTNTVNLVFGQGKMVTYKSKDGRYIIGVFPDKAGNIKEIKMLDTKTKKAGTIEITETANIGKTVDVYRQLLENLGSEEPVAQSSNIGQNVKDVLGVDVEQIISNAENNGLIREVKNPNLTVFKDTEGNPVVTIMVDDSSGSRTVTTTYVDKANNTVVTQTHVKGKHIGNYVYKDGVGEYTDANGQVITEAQFNDAVSVNTAKGTKSSEVSQQETVIKPVEAKPAETKPEQTLYTEKEFENLIQWPISDKDMKNYSDEKLEALIADLTTVSENPKYNGHVASFDIELERIHSNINKMKSELKIRTENKQKALASRPKDVMKPTEASTITNPGITFKPNPEGAPAKAYRLIWCETVEETIARNNENGIPLELFLDPATGEYKLGIKHSWDDGYFAVDRESAIVNYDYTAEKPSDWAVVAEDKGAQIFSKTYLNKETGKTAQLTDIEPGQGIVIVKNPEATVGASAFEGGRPMTSLEEDMGNVDFVRTDVDGHPYGTFNQLAKDIDNGKLLADPNDPNSAKFVDLVKEGKKAETEGNTEKANEYFNEAKKLLGDATKEKETVTSKSAKPEVKPVETKPEQENIKNTKQKIPFGLQEDTGSKTSQTNEKTSNDIVVTKPQTKNKSHRIPTDSPEFKAIESELKELHKVKPSKLTKEQKARLSELEAKVQEQGVLTARSPIVETEQISAIAKAEPRTIFLPDFSNEAQLRAFRYEILEPGWYTGQSEPVDIKNPVQLAEALKKAGNKEVNGTWFNSKGEAIDLGNPESLKKAGLKEINKRGWYNKNLDWFPDELTDDKVIYVFEKDAQGNPIDTGHGPKHELATTYVYSGKSELEYVKAEDMTPGVTVEAQKCASGNICVLPVGEKVFTSEGVVTVKPGQIAIIKEGSNSMFLTTIDKLNKMYVPDPMNPTSKELFELSRIFDKLLPLTEEQKQLAKENGVKYDKSPLTAEEKALAKKYGINYEKGPITEAQAIELQAKIANIFETINKGQKLIEILGTGEAPKDLKEEYEVAARISKTIDEKYLSRIDCSDFKKAIEQAGKVMDEILADNTLNEAQKEAAIMGIMAHMITTTNLHQHGKGSTPKEVTLALAREKGLPEETIKDIEAAYAKADKGYPALSEFNKAYDVIGQVIRTPEDYKASINGIIRESMKRGQLVCEIRCACDSLRDATTGQSLSPREGTLAILNAIEEVKAEIRAEGLEPPKTSFVFLTFRGKGWDGSIPMATTQALEAVRIAQEHPEMKFGFDIAGPEDTGWGPKAFKEAIDVINKYNADVESGKIEGNPIGITMHAGETPSYEGGEGYQSVLDAIEMGAKRVGHGVALARHLKNLETSDPVEFARVLKLVKDSGVTIEICGVCNIQSIPINSADMNQHAIQTFLEYGIPVSICTDNDAICGTNISKEYTQFLLTGHSNFMDWNAIKQSVRDGVEASFIPEADKADVRAELENRIGLVQQCYEDAKARANEKKK